VVQRRRRTGLLQRVGRGEGHVGRMGLRQPAHPRAPGGQQWRGRVGFIQVLDDGQRLEQHRSRAVVQRKGRKHALRVDGPEALAVLFPASHVD
jgi:hypothetical protein